MKQQSLKIFLKEKTGPYELPKGWRWVRLGEVLKEDRKTINPQDYPAENFWLVTMDCVESNTGKLLKKINLCGKEIKSTKYQFNFNHVLYGKLRPYLNKVYAVPEGERGICTTEFIPFIPLNADKKYIAFYLRKKEVIEFAMNNLTGTRQPRVNIEALLSFQIPLPSLPEQKRIVARIEALFSKIDEIKRLRKEANDLAKTLLPSALHEVFSKADEKGWKWVRLGDKNIAKIIMGQSPPSTTYNQDRIGLPFYQGKTDFGDLYPSPRIWCSIPNKIAESGDILISVRAPVGPVNMCREKSCIGRGLAAIRPTNQIDNFFLFYYFKYIEGTWTGRGSTFGAIKKRELENLQIPLPPLPEQKRIIAYLGTIQQKAQALQRLQEETEKEIERLKETILHKAFRGEL